MIINNTEALKSWMIVVLDPLCDADSSALARYVLALLKKDKPEKELKRVMVEQLDVFLGEETTPFVDRLLGAIKTEEYLIPPAPILTKSDNGSAATASSSNSQKAADTKEPTKSDVHTKQQQQQQQTAEHGSAAAMTLAQRDNSDTTNTPHEDHKTKENHSRANEHSERTTSAHYNSGKTATSTSGGHHGNHVRSASPPLKSVNAEKDTSRESRRRRASLRSRSRSRSRSNERASRRSRSRDRRPAKDFDKNQRQFRNKSPPSQQSDGRYGMNAHDRRRAGGGGGGGGGDRRRMGGGGPVGDRSPRFGAGGGDAGGGMRKPNRGNRSNSRSRSPSVERGGGRGKASPPNVRSSGNRGNSPDRSDRHRHHHPSSSQQHQQQQQQQQLQQQPESGQQQQQQPGQPQPQDGEKRQRCRDFDEKGYCVRGETCPWDHGVNPVVFEGINNPALMNMSMREYNPDSPDLWARSANPSGIGGAPQPVPGPLAGPGAGLVSGAAGINPFSGSVRPAGLIAYPHLGDKVANGVAGNLAADYARSAATGVGFRGAAPMLPFPFNPTGVATPLQRELIPIPVVDAGGMGMGGDLNAQMQQGKRRFDLEDSVAIADGPTKRKLPIGSRLGPRIPNMQNNCSLELRKVPRGLNTIAHLNNHFAKFGKIVNIQISYDGDPEAAIVTFSTHAEANVAYRSTEAVLNNRFIKVFWHSQDPNAVQPAGQDGGNVMPMTGGRKNSQYHLNNVPAMPTPSADSAKTTNAAAAGVATSQAGGSAAGSSTTTTVAADGSGVTTATTLASGTVAATHVLPPSLRLKNNVAPRGGPSPANSMNLRKKQEEQAKAVHQLANGLRKRKQELLQSYVKQMKSTLELVERCEPSDPQRTKTLETIKILQETIDKLRKEIAAEQEQMQAQIQNQQPMPPAKKSKEQQKKELLDIELELFAQQQEGNDTTAIQKRLEELQRSLGIIPPGGPNAQLGGAAAKGHYPGGRAAQRGRASYPEGPTRVDRRPKTIVVTGFTSEEADFVLGHFKHFGEITKHDVDKDIPQIILSYATRVNAEQAVIRGKLFKDKRLQIAWAPSVQPLAGPGSDSSNSKTLELKHDPKEALISTSELSEGDGNVIGSDNMDTLPELRLEDEEEDEECEDRSWRR